MKNLLKWILGFIYLIYLTPCIILFLLICLWRWNTEQLKKWFDSIIGGLDKFLNLP
jgi:uncharacterized membrane protein YesL